MNPESYSSEQQKDIAERVEKARVFLVEQQLQPSAQVSIVNLGDDVFAQKVQPYLQDTKYAPKLSDIQPEDL